MSDFESETTDRLARIETTGETTQREIAAILYLLRGNGAPGLVRDMDRLKTVANVLIWFVAMLTTAVGARMVWLVFAKLGAN